MPVMPGSFDEHPAQVGIAGFRDAPLRPFRPARMLGRDQADKRHRAGRRGEATGIAEFRGDGQCGEIIDTAEASQAFHACAQGFEIEKRPELGFNITQTGEHLIDRAQIGAMCLVERRQRMQHRLREAVLAA